MRAYSILRELAAMNRCHMKKEKTARDGKTNATYMSMYAHLPTYNVYIIGDEQTAFKLR